MRKPFFSLMIIILNKGIKKTSIYPKIEGIKKSYLLHTGPHKVQT
jgi:hypothetical protein